MTLHKHSLSLALLTTSMAISGIVQASEDKNLYQNESNTIVLNKKETQENNYSIELKERVFKFADDTGTKYAVQGLENILKGIVSYTKGTWTDGVPLTGFIAEKIGYGSSYVLFPIGETFLGMASMHRAPGGGISALIFDLALRGGFCVVGSGFYVVGYAPQAYGKLMQTPLVGSYLEERNISAIAKNIFENAKNKVIPIQSKEEASKTWTQIGTDVALDLTYNAVFPTVFSAVSNIPMNGYLLGETAGLFLGGGVGGSIFGGTIGFTLNGIGYIINKPMDSYVLGGIAVYLLHSAKEEIKNETAEIVSTVIEETTQGITDWHKTYDTEDYRPGEDMQAQVDAVVAIMGPLAKGSYKFVNTTFTKLQTRLSSFWDFILD